MRVESFVAADAWLDFVGLLCFVFSYPGTAAFMAPEMCAALFGDGGDEAPAYSMRAADVWAAGVSLYNLVFGRVPFEAHTVLKMYEAIATRVFTMPRDLPVSDALCALLERLLQKQPAERATLAEVRVHAWVTDGGRWPMPPPPAALAPEPSSPAALAAVLPGSA